MNVETMHETKTHGTQAFPYAVYKGNIPDYIKSFPLHWHDELEIIYVESGRGTVTVGSKRYDVGDGDIVVVLPQTIHSIEQYQDRRMEYFNILFDFSLLTYSTNDVCYEKYFKPLYNHTKQPPSLMECDSEHNAALLKNVKYLIANRKNAANDELMIISNLFELMHKLNAMSVAASSAELSLKNNYDKLKNLLVYVRSHYDREISIAEAAEICWFSPSHFMKLFKDMTGKGFTQYLIDYRLEIAAARLADSRDKIIDVAQAVGFNNTSYFSRAFFDKYGVTPSAYRAAAHGAKHNDRLRG